MARGRRRVLIAGAVGVAAATVGALTGLGLSRSDRGGAALMAAELSDLAGRRRKLSEWKGKIIVCNFWATWCQPCREEIPMLMALNTQMASKGVQVVGIAVDYASKVSAFAQDYKITYPILVAGPAGLDLMRASGNQVGGLPYTAFVDREGKIASTKLGALKESETRQQLAQMLRS